MRRLRAEAAGDQDEMLRAQAEAERLNANRMAVAPTGSQTFTEVQEAGDYGNFLQNVAGGGTASMLKPLAGATVGQLVGGALRLRRGAGAMAGSAAGSYDMIGNMEALEASQDEEAQALSPQDRLRMVRTSAAAQTLPEALLPSRIATGFGRSMPGRVATGAVTESATEAAQNLIDTGVESQFIDGRRPDWQAVRDDAIAGGIFGGGASAFAGGDAAPAPERTDGQPVDPPALDAPAPTAPTPIAPEAGPAETGFSPAPETTERVPESVEDPYADAKQAGRDAFDNVKSTAERIVEAASSAKTPQEFLKSMLGDRLNTDLEPILLGPEDPGLAGTTIEETVANLERRDAENIERTRKLSEQILNDESYPASVRNRMFDMDYADPANQRFVAETIQSRARTERVSNAVNDVIKTAKDFTKGVKDAVKDAKVKKSNLQSASPTEQAGFNKVIYDSLTDEAKANPTIRQKLPELAQALVAFASRTGDLTQKDLRTLTKLQGDLDGMFNDPDALIKQLVTYAQVPQGSQSFVERMRQISNAQQDVRGSENSFLASSLTPEARETLGPEQITQLAKLVDNFTVIDADPMEGDRILAGLDMAFGDRDTTRAVLDYYGQLNNIELTEDSGPEQTQEVEATQEVDEDGETTEVSGFDQGITEQDAANLTGSFRAPDPRRPFRKGRDDKALEKRLKEAGTDGRVGSMKDYIAQSDESPTYMAKRIRADLQKRIEAEAQRDTKSVQDKIKLLESQPELTEEQANELKSLKSRKTEDRPNLEVLRQELRDQDAALEKARKAGTSPAEALLDLYSVVMREESDVQASDEQIAQFREPLERKANPLVGSIKQRADKREANALLDRTVIKFSRKEGPDLRLSAEAMVINSRARGSLSARLSDSIAAVLARPEITGLIEPEPSAIVMRNKKGKHTTWGQISPKVEKRPLTDGQKAALKDRMKKRAFGKMMREGDDFNNRNGLMAAIRRTQLSSLHDRAKEQGIEIPEGASLRQASELFKGKENIKLEDELNELGFQAALGWARSATKRDAEVMEQRDYKNESRLRVLKDYITQQLDQRPEYEMPQRSEFTDIVGAIESEAGVYSEVGDVSADVMFAEAQVAALQNRLEAVQGIRSLESRIKDQIANINKQLDKELVGTTPSAPIVEAVKNPARIKKNSKMGTVTKKQQGIDVDEDFEGDIDPMDNNALPANLREQAGYDPKTTPKEQTKRIKKNTFVGAMAYPFDAAQAKFHLTMNQSKAAAEKIFKETGWFKGPDGKVRKELDPRPVVQKVIESLNDNNIEMTLGTLLAELDPTVASRYRNKIGKVRVNLAAVNSPQLDGAAGQFDPGKGQILISPVHSVLSDMPEKDFAAFNQYLSDGAGTMVYDDQSLFETLYEWSQETNTKLPDVYTSTAKTFIHEMQHAIQLAEGFENGGSPELAAVVAYGDPKAYKKATLANDPEARGEVVNKAIQNMVKAFGPDADVQGMAQKLYKRITGEAEAYNVEDRLNLTDAERREILPELMGSPDGFIRSMVNMIAGKMVNQSTMRGRKGRAGQLSEADRQAIIAEIRRTRGDKVKISFEKFADIGGSGEFSMNPNKTDRLIRIAINSLNPMGVAWHESLHDFFNVIGGNKVENQMKKSLLESASSPYVMHKLKQLLKDHPDALEQIKTDKEERLAYMYQFWAEGELQVTPDANGIFTRIAQFFRDLLGIVSQDQKTQAIFEAFHQGQFANPNITAAVMQDLKAQTLGEKLRDVSGPVAQWADAALVSSTDRLRDTAVPALEEIADLFMPGVGQERPGDSFIQKRSQTTHKYVNRLQAILEDTNATDRRQALNHLQAMGTPRNQLERDIKSILDDLHTYMVKAGVKRYDPVRKDWVDMGKVENYFPRVFDREYLRTHKAEWVKLLTPYVGVEQAYKTHEALLSGDGTLELNESEHHLGYTPFAKSVQNRQFTFIDETNAAEFAKFQEKDLTDTLTTYIQQATHRGEYARFFGNDGEVIQEKLKQAENQGATEDDVNTASKSIRALEGTLGSDFNPRLRTLMSGIVAYQNFILLPLALFTNIVDPIGVAVRSGDINEAGKAFMYGMQGVIRGLKKEGLDAHEEMAKTLGLINEEHILETMGDVYSSRYTPKSVKRLSNKFFKYNGLQMWDRRMRTAAMMTGQRFIIKNVDHKRYMDELGIKPSDVYVNADGTMAITKDQIADHLRALGKSQKQIDKQSEEIEARVHAGLYKFVDSAVVRPTAAQQPIWVSDPRFQLLSHFKQFTFSFHNTILKRVGHEWQNENATPAMLLMAYVPFMFAADVTRGLLTGTINPESFDFYDQLGRSIVRSGIMGTGTFGADVEGDVGRGNLPGLSLLGPAFDHLRVLLEFLTGDASFEKTALRSLPGGTAVRGFV
jgi:hypothetical protein